MAIRYLFLGFALTFGPSSLPGQEEGPLHALYESGQCPQLVEAVKRQSNDSLSAQICFYSGVCLMELADYQSALGYLDQAIRKDRDLAIGYFFKAEVLFQLNRLPEALIQYDNAIHLRPEVPDFRVSKGQAFFQAGRYPEAIACLQQALLMPSCPEKAFILLGRAYQENKETDLAFNTFYKALESLDPQGPNYPECLHRIGQAQYLAKDYPAAEAAYSLLLAKKPADYQGVSKLIQVHYAKGEYEKGNALKMKLYSAYRQNLLPTEMVETGFCFDQFEWQGKRIYAYEKLDEPTGYYPKHIFMVTDERDHVTQVVQTEHTLAASLKGKKYVLGKIEDGVHTLYEKEAFDDNFEYDLLKKAVIRVLKGKGRF